METYAIRRKSQRHSTTAMVDIVALLIFFKFEVCRETLLFRISTLVGCVVDAGDALGGLLFQPVGFDEMTITNDGWAVGCTVGEEV